VTENAVLLLVLGIVLHGLLIGSTTLISREYAQRTIPLRLSLVFLVAMIGAPLCFVLAGFRMI
jgi:hypothetical protein